MLKISSDNNWNLIYSYSREQAIADDVLIDVTDHAKPIGFKIPTAITDHLYHGYVEVPSGLDLSFSQSTTGRLHDLLTLAMFAARTSKGNNFRSKLDNILQDYNKS